MLTLPTIREARKQRPRDAKGQACCVKRMTRPSPTASPAASDDEGEDIILDGGAEGEGEGEQQLDVMDCIEGMLELTTQAGGRGDNTFLSCSV